MGVNMIKRSVGRPKTLSREHVINTAFGEYWLHGINNVPVSKIALSSGVSRPGIYIEFKNEDTLKSEVLKKYIDEAAVPVHKNYDDYKKYPNQLLNHIYTLINDRNDNIKLSDDLKYTSTEKPKNAIGCMLIRAILLKFTLGPVSLKVISDFEEYRLKQFKKYIINAKNDEVFNKNLDPDFYAKYLQWVFASIQIMRLNKIPKDEITKIINASLIPLFKTTKMLNS
jgi:AcrR family transcriptional regulator